MTSIAESTTLHEHVEQIRVLIDAERLADAERTLDAAQSKWPRSQALVFERAVLQSHQGQTDAASATFADMLTQGNIAHLAERIATTLKAAPPGFPQGRVLVDAVLGSDLPLHAQHQILEALTTPKTETAGAFLAYTAERSKLHRYEFRYAVRETDQGHWRNGLAMLEKAQSEGRASPISVGLYAELLSVADRDVDAIALLRRQIKTEPEDREAHRKLVKILQRTGAHDDAANALEAALQAWPDDWMLIRRFNLLPMEADHRAALYRLVKAETTSDFRLRFQVAIAALFHGDMARARDFLRGDDYGTLTPMRDAISAVINSESDDFWQVAPREGVETARDVTVIAKPGAKTVVIVPSGTAFGLLPMRMLDATLSKFDVSVIYLKDFNKRVYLRGVRSLGVDLPSTLEALDRLVHEIGGEDMVYLGCSSGGFSAHRMAALSGARAAFSYAGMVDLDLYLSGLTPTAWNEELLQAELLAKEADKDNRPFLRAASDTRFVHVVGDIERDQAQATLLDEVEGAERLHAQGSDHLVVNTFRADGRFADLLESAL